MVTIVAKIMLIFRVDYREFPPFFLIQMGGTGAKKMSIILAATGITFSVKGSLPP